MLFAESEKSLFRVVHCSKDPDGEIENSGKGIFEIQIPNFCYIQVAVFDCSYQPVAAVGTLSWKNVKNVKIVFHIFPEFSISPSGS